MPNRLLGAVVVGVCLITTLGAQQAGVTLAELETRLANAERELTEVRALAVRLKGELPTPSEPGTAGTVINVGCAADARERADAFQQALNDVRAGGTVAIEPGCEYVAYGFANQITGFQFKGNKGGKVTLTTRGFTASPLAGHAGRVTPDFAPRMGIIRAGTANVHYALEIWNGPDGGNIEIVGVMFAHALPAGHGEMLKIGRHDETDPAMLAKNVVVRQSVFKGSEQFGQKRAIAPMGRNTLIEQNWCEEMWVDGQDSQCVGTWIGGKGLIVRFNFLEAASENVMIGGSSNMSVTEAMTPEDVLIEDNLLPKPLRWYLDKRPRQVKNCIEFKFGRRLTARRNACVNNWVASQTGAAILLTYATNGRCPRCPGLHDVVIEDNAILNSAAGVQIAGHAHDLGTLSPEKLHDLTIRNNYFVLTGSGGLRTIMITSVKGEHNIRWERNTIINGTMSTWLAGDWGAVWTGPMDGTAVRGPGGPMQGFWFVDNVVTHSGTYGATMPDGVHWGSGMATYVTANLQVAGNVFGDGGTGAVTNLRNINKYTAGGALNTLVPKAQLLAALPATSCGEAQPGKGADCAKLEPVFAMLKYLPEP